MAEPSSPSPSLSHTSRGTIIHELKKIWDEIGESDNEKEKMLLELEQECLDIYQRKVEYMRNHKADLYEALAEGESEIARLSAALGVTTPFSQPKGTLKEQLSSVKLTLDDLRLKKQQRVRDFLETELQITRIRAEIEGNDQVINQAEPQVNEDDLTTSRLSERESHLEELQKNKVLRLQNIHNHITSIRKLSKVMSLDFISIVAKIHPSLVDTEHGQSKSISKDTLSELTGVVNWLKQEKKQRLLKIQGLGTELIELWNLLETSLRDQNKFEDVIGYNKASVDEVQWPKALSQEVIEQAENEVARLKVLKGLKMEDLPQSPGQIAQLDILEEGSRMMEYQYPVKTIAYKDVIVEVSHMGPKLVAVYVQERFARRKVADVDINRSYGYYSFAYDIQAHCQELDQLDHPVLPHICSPWYPIWGITEYYACTKEGEDKEIYPLMMGWERFSGEVEKVVILPSGQLSSHEVVFIDFVDSLEVAQELPIFKGQIEDSAQLARAIYIYYCSFVQIEPRFEDKEPDEIWMDAKFSYLDDQNKKLEVELCDDGVLGMSDEDFLRELARISISLRGP